VWGANPPGGTCQRATFLLFAEGGTDGQTKFVVKLKKFKKSNLAIKKVGGSKIRKLQGKERKKAAFRFFAPGSTLSLRH